MDATMSVKRLRLQPVWRESNSCLNFNFIKLSMTDSLFSEVQGDF